MKDVDFLEIIKQVFPFIGTEHAQGKADQRPQMYHAVVGAIMLAQLMDLSVAIVAGSNTIIRPGGLDLIVFKLPVLQTLFFKSGLQETASPTATEIVRTVGVHVNKVLFSNNRPHHKAQVFSNRISIAFANDLAGILHSELDFEIFVPVGIDLESAFPDPTGIILINTFDFKFMRDVEFFQSGPD
jgi:hypothetical protein